MSRGQHGLGMGGGADFGWSFFCATQPNPWGMGEWTLPIAGGWTSGPCRLLADGRVIRSKGDGKETSFLPAVNTVACGDQIERWWE